MKVKIQNKRNHVVDLAADVKVPALGSLTLEMEKWKEIYAGDKYKRMLVTKNFISIDRIPETKSKSKSSKGGDK